MINTSILPCSYETTEREFSLLSVSPLNSPRIPNGDGAPSAILTTEATVNRKKCAMERPPKILISEENESCSGSISVESFEERDVDFNNYLKKHRGDDDQSPSFIFSDTQSRQSSINYNHDKMMN